MLFEFGLALVGFVLAMAWIFLPWVNLYRNKNMREDILDLQSQLQDMQLSIARLSRGEGVPVKQQNATPDPLIQEHKKREIEIKESLEKESRQHWGGNPEVVAESISQRVQRRKEKRKAKKSFDFEKQIGTKLPVWIGAISLIFAGFFLVKYSIDAGLLGPEMRVTLGGLLGVLLLVGGQFLSTKKKVANAARMSQGLVGAGLVTLYVVFYATVNLYEMLPTLIGFIGMAFVTVTAMIMALKHGRVIAVFGLVGGLVTPALVGSVEPNTIGLFSYLFLLSLGLLTLFARMEWWGLAITTLVGLFMWTGLWILAAFTVDDAFAVTLFTIGIAGLTLFITSKYMTSKGSLEAPSKAPMHSLNIIALSGVVLTVLWMGANVTMDLFDWAVLASPAIALQGLVYFKPAIYQRPLVLLGVVLTVLFASWSDMGAMTDDVITVAIGLAAIYVAVPFILGSKVKDPRFFAGLQIASALILMIVSSLVIEVPIWFADIVWGMFGLAAATLWVYQAQMMRSNSNYADEVKEHLVAFYSIGATGFISFALTISLPFDYLAMAISAQVLATAWIYRETQMAFLRKIIMGLSVAFICLNYGQILMFLDIMMSGIFIEGASSSSIRKFGLDHVYVMLGVPAFFLASAFVLIEKMDKTALKLPKCLFKTASLLIVAFVYYAIRDAFNLGNGLTVTQSGFLERGVITFAIAGLGGASLYLIKRYGWQYLQSWAMFFICFAVLRIAYFDILVQNPHDTSDFVGDWFLLNGITLTYGGAFALIAWAHYQGYLESISGFMRFIYRATALIALFLFSSFTVRHMFHGGTMYPREMTDTEMYSYSIAWFVTGAALLSVGIWKENQVARKVSAAFIGLTVFKVFIFDAGDLEGLYRVFSFLGLGISLIGLSYFYSKYVFDGKMDVKEAA